jgi:NADH dehydrogenase
MNRQQVVILGGSGFVGRHLSTRLQQQGYGVRIVSRRDGDAGLAGTEWIQCDVHDAQALKQAFRGADAAINLVGILNETGHNGRGFRHAHVELSHKVIQACRGNGIHRLLHMSALGANAASGSSYYLRSKGEAENAVHASGLKVTSFRPSVIFGDGDSFLNRFAALLAIPGPFPLACAQARFAPIWVEDVVSCFAHALTDERTIGQRYNLCGPGEYTLEELVRYTAELLGKRKWILPLGDTLSALQARVLEWVPGKPFSRDNLHSTRTPSICDAGFPEIFAISPTPLEAIAPIYLGKARP